jgi:hypothetical protein
MKKTPVAVNKNTILFYDVYKLDILDFYRLKALLGSTDFEKEGKSSRSKTTCGFIGTYNVLFGSFIF